ncbi:MAG: 4-hydroxy-tetrahydrodipicolinate reductase [Burkholderiales bacterium]|jgi:4-hydroxy-tetrahydrodipicolinate reductase|nr:4-hydroxy-tetrahydrodipicolinate reductase [Burkholderiales bacterium]
MTRVVNAPIRVAIAGAGGRMGQVLIELTLQSSKLKFGAALEQEQSPLLGCDAGARIGHPTGILISSNIDEAMRGSDVLIDFTRPCGTLRHAEVCADHGCAMVIGTTGFSEDEKAALAQYAGKVPMVIASNMSVGVTVLKRLVEFAAKRLGSGYDVEIVEIHHKHKVDAPSGTALLLGEAAAAGMGVQLKDKAIFAREGVTGERPVGAIGFATLRGGDVVGEHTVVFCGEGERVELTHRAGSRRNFAAGALRAAEFVVAQEKTGVYSMEDVLGLS